MMQKFFPGSSLSFQNFRTDLSDTTVVKGVSIIVEWFKNSTILKLFCTKLWVLSLSWVFDNAILFFSLTRWQMAQCVRVAFFNFKDLMKDTFLLSKMIISVGGVALILNPSSFGTIVSLSI